MGGKKKTKWRKLPLGELTQGTARGSTVSGNLREQIEDGLHESDYRNHHDIKSEEPPRKETRHAGYNAQGPPHLYSSNMTLQGDEDVGQEETMDNDGKPGIFLNGFWIPESDLEQLNIINHSSSFEPFYRQIPVFLYPPIMPYCSAPYPHFRTAYSPDAPFLPNFGIPSDPHYYYYLTRTMNKEEDQSFERDEGNTSPLNTNSDFAEKQEPSPQESNCDEGENQPETLLPEVTSEATALPYPYPGYTFGEPVYSVPIYPVFPPVQRAFPRPAWSNTQTQRKRRRKRKEYNADYAVIPATKSSSQGSRGHTGAKSDLGATCGETTSNNESCDHEKGNGIHSVSVTGSSPSNNTETKRSVCVQNNQANDDAESACLGQEEVTSKDTTAESTEIPRNGHCEITDTNGFSCQVEDDALVLEILSELIQEVVKKSQQDQKQTKDKNTTSNCQSSQNETGNFVTFCVEDKSEYVKVHNKGEENSNEKFVECENAASPHVEMENILRKNQNADFPEVHKKVQDDLGVGKNVDSYISSKNYKSSEGSDDNFVRNENLKNLTHGKPVILSINEDNKFFEVALFTEEGEEGGSSTNLKTSVSNNIEYKEPENEQHEIQEDAKPITEQTDNLTTAPEKTIDSLENPKIRTESSSDSENASEYLDIRTDNSGITNFDDEVKASDLDKSGNDSLDSITSNESCRDRDKHQFSDSHRSSPHSFLSYVSNSEALIRETELELSKIQHLTSRPPLQANQSIYKFAFDENLTDQSDTEDTMTPVPSPMPQLSNDAYSRNEDPDDPAASAEMRQDVQRSEIVLHEGDSGSEAGSEDVELLPHRYESQGASDKHLYVNKLSLAVELLRTHEELPYDEEFKRVVDDEGDNAQNGKVPTANSKSRSNKAANDVSSGMINPAFIGDSSLKIEKPAEISLKSVIKTGPASALNLRQIEQGQNYRHSRISTADSGVQSEESGDETGEEAKETYGRLGFTESEEQELWNPADDATMGYRRFGAQARQRFNVFAPREGSLNPCFCCIIM